VTPALAAEIRRLATEGLSGRTISERLGGCSRKAIAAVLREPAPVDPGSPSVAPVERALAEPAPAAEVQAVADLEVPDLEVPEPAAPSLPAPRQAPPPSTPAEPSPAELLARARSRRERELCEEYLLSIGKAPADVALRHALRGLGEERTI